MKTIIEYEVFAESVWGSDVLSFDSEERALEEAKSWKKENPNATIIVEKITKEIVYKI